jgi:hypothetical protein
MGLYEESQEIVKNFNEELETGIKELVGTSGLDPRKVEDGEIKANDLWKEFREKGYKVTQLIEHPADRCLILTHGNEYIAGVRVSLDIKTMEIKRQMMAHDEALEGPVKKLMENLKGGN